ncbi:type VI secretion system contractile sheath small subunit [Pirellulaceae bacterium]|jgi:type VI secretion system protein ImpB|nr:type VI secretion system contractile sheath small subunit [Pirellulaceae bacterium]
MAKASGQKFVARNRAPRVQIEYDVEVYGSQKKVQLPFVMGVLADLSGKPAEALPGLADRKFLEIDVDNFDDRLKATKPRVAFNVPNTLTGEGNLSVDVTFESMDDFSPDAVAEKIEPLKKLLDVRNELSNLLTYMDGKSGAEELLAKLMQDPSLMSSLASVPKQEAAAAPQPAAAAPETPAPAPAPAPAPEAPAPAPEAPAPAPEATKTDDKPEGDGDDDLDSLLADL